MISVRHKLISVVVGLMLLASCSPPVEVGLRGDAAPTFILSGRGRVYELEIYEVLRRDDGGQCFCLAWRIEQGETMASDGKRADAIKEIKYGDVPEGFEQTYPVNGSPAAIAPEQYYEYWIHLKGEPVEKREFGIFDGRLTFTLKE
jgi:hypothetical protein